MIRLLNIHHSLLSTSAGLHIIRRYAGHSKWANIKHIKAAKDSQRSQLFMKLCQKIKVAIQDGGSSNPDSNLHLAQAIEVAKKQCMPIASINNCIKSAQNDKAKAESKWFEIRGPNGCLVIALALTDNHKKVRDNIATILRKTNTSFGNHGFKHNFEHKGIIIAKPPVVITNPEVTIDHAIECGAEEVNASEVEQGVYEFLCEIDQLSRVQGKLQNLNYTIQSAEFEFIPKVKVELNDEQIVQVTKLIDKLEDLPEIVKVYDNIA